jgi:hypothetical protein
LDKCIDPPHVAVGGSNFGKRVAFGKNIRQKTKVFLMNFSIFDGQKKVVKRVAFPGYATEYFLRLSKKFILDNSPQSVLPL